jgi:hypothetical protein
LGRVHRRRLNGRCLPPGGAGTKDICSGVYKSVQVFRIPFHAYCDSNNNPGQSIPGQQKAEQQKEDRQKEQEDSRKGQRLDISTVAYMVAKEKRAEKAQASTSHIGIYTQYASKLALYAIYAIYTNPFHFYMLLLPAYMFLFVYTTPLLKGTLIAQYPLG